MYRIKKISIGHNKRMRSGLIESIEYSPESPFQVITGPNGAGKSAMMDELSLIPSAKASFAKDGYSIITTETDEGEIETRTYVGSSARHEFWKDGVNLNTGGTASVQKDLAMKYFKVGDLAYEIINKSFSFTKATPAKRQEIMTKLANNDMTYAYGLYTEAKRKLSHSNGAKKMLEESIAEKRVLLISDQELAILNERLNQYREQVVDILKEQSHHRHNPATDLTVNWSNLGKRIARLSGSFPTSNIDAQDRADYVEKISGIEGIINTLRTQERVLQNEYDEVDDLLKRSSDASSENIEKLKNEKEYLLRQQSELDEIPLFKSAVFSGITNLAQVERELSSIWSEWKSVYGEITPDIEGVFTRENYQNKKALHEKYHGHLNTLGFKLSRVEEQLTHLNEGSKVNCPKCGLHFIPGVSIDARPRLEAEANKIRESIEKGRTALEELNRELEVIDKWINDYKSIMSLERVCPSSAFFFTAVGTLVDTKAQPLQTIVVATQLLQDLETLVRKERLNERIQEVEGILKRLEENNVQGIQGIIERHGLLKIRIQEINESIQVQEASKRQMDKLLREADFYTNAVTESTTQFEELSRQTANEIEGHFNVVREIIVQDLQGHIGSLTKQINDVETLKQVIEELETQLTKQKKLIRGYTHLVKVFSPKNGVVAEQMKGFNESFIKGMNDVIEAVWTYPMEVLPGKKENEVIDYLFPYRLNDSTEIISDISEGSEGQLAIFNFAFLVTAMVYLEQVNVPLLLDEVERAMEPAHKERLMYFLTRGVESGRFSQLFLISHHATSHGALPFSDVIDFNYREPREGSNKVAILK